MSSKILDTEISVDIGHLFHTSRGIRHARPGISVVPAADLF